MALLTFPTMGSTSSMASLNDARQSAAEAAEIAKIRDLFTRTRTSAGGTSTLPSVWRRAVDRMEKSNLRATSKTLWSEAMRDPAALIPWARTHADRGHVAGSSQALKNLRVALQDALGRQRVSTQTTAGDAEYKQASAMITQLQQAETERLETASGEAATYGDDESVVESVESALPSIANGVPMWAMAGGAAVVGLVVFKMVRK